MGHQARSGNRQSHLLLTHSGGPLERITKCTDEPKPSCQTQARSLGSVTTKEFGFIQRAGGQDLFVHYTAIQAEDYRGINRGNIVDFEVVEGDKGL